LCRRKVQILYLVFNYRTFLTCILSWAKKAYCLFNVCKNFSNKSFFLFSSCTVQVWYPRHTPSIATVRPRDALQLYCTNAVWCLYVAGLLLQQSAPVVHWARSSSVWNLSLRVSLLSEMSAMSSLISWVSTAVTHPALTTHGGFTAGSLSRIGRRASTNSQVICLFESTIFLYLHQSINSHM